MVDFVFPSKEQGWIHGVRGVVTGAKNWTETHVSSSGGGGYVGSEGGYVSAPSVSSRIVEKGEVWIKTAGGKEVQIKRRLDANAGHEVAILWGNLEGVETGPYLYWTNYTSQMHGLFDPIDKKLLETPGEKRGARLTFWLGWVALFVLGCITTSRDSPFAGVVGFIFGWIPPLILVRLIRFPQEERLKELTEALQRLADNRELSWNG